MKKIKERFDTYKKDISKNIMFNIKNSKESIKNSKNEKTINDDIEL